jgi:hypothetical protein
MARQKGILRIKGTIGGMTFYKTALDGDLVREKGGVSGERIASDPAFIRTRENGAEFGAAGLAGKLLRDTLRALMMTASDTRVTSRLTKTMMDILKLDITSQRGQRTPAIGLTTAQGKAMLKGFNFNLKAIMGSILFKPYTVNTMTGEIDIPNLVAINDIAAPAGATHCAIKGAFANIDFATGLFDIKFSTPINLVLDGMVSNVSLIPPAVPAGTGLKFYMLEIEFFQEVNGQQYSLKNGAYNSLAIVEVV